MISFRYGRIEMAYSILYRRIVATIRVKKSASMLYAAKKGSYLCLLSKTDSDQSKDDRGALQHLERRECMI